MVLGGNLVKGEALVKRKLMLLLKERWYSCFKKSNQGNGQVLCDPCQTSRLRADDPSPWTPSKVFNFLATFLLDFSKSSTRDFFLNLDNLHDYLKYTFPKVIESQEEPQMMFGVATKDFKWSL